MNPLKIYTPDELGLKDLRYKYEDIAKHLNNDDFMALDGSVVCFNTYEFLKSITPHSLGNTSYVIYDGDSYSSYLSHIFTFQCKNEYLTITIFA